MRSVTIFLIAYFAILFAASIPKGMVPPSMADLTWGALSSIGIVILTRTMLARTSTEAPGALATGSAPQFLAGLALGVTTYLLTLAAIHVTVGPLHVSASSTPPSGAAIALTVAGFLALSCMEELGFRGYALRAIQHQHGTLVAVAVTSIAFAAFHLLFGWPLATVLLGVLPSGVLFATAALTSGGLAIPIALHAAVNITMALLGEKGSPGLVALTLDPVHTALATRITPFIGAAVPLLVSAALSLLSRRR